MQTNHSSSYKKDDPENMHRLNYRRTSERVLTKNERHLQLTFVHSLPVYIKCTVALVHILLDHEVCHPS